ncbi:MAG: acyl-CoA thioesterase [Chloroflexota bacterium]|nr:acyl-CoA thioesterase [Chloroflexota bacterium]
MTNLAQSFPYKVTIEVAFRDLDAMGHVNNAVYLSYMETARIKFLVDLLAVTSLHDLPVIMAEATCTFKAPAFFGELLTVGVGVSRFGSKSFDMTYRIDTSDGRLIALGRTVQVMYDYAAAQTMVMPEAFKTKILTFQGAWAV